MGNYMGNVPPFIRHRESQYDAFMGSSGCETGDDALKSLIRAQKVHRLSYSNGVWTLYKGEVEDPGNFTGDIISIGYYDPHFIVRAIKIWVDATTLFGTVVYDIPHSSRMLDTMACGSMHPIQITRIYLGDYSRSITATEIWLYG